MNPEIKETINAKYAFNDKERMEFGERIAHKLQEQAVVGEEFSAIKKQWAGKLETIANEISTLAQKISSGFDYRPTECKVTFDTAKRRKYYFRCSDGTPAYDEEMTANDFAMNLPLEETETASTPPEPGKIVSVGEALEAAQDHDVPAEPPVEESTTPAKKKGVKSRKPKTDPFPTAGGIVNPTPDLPLKDDDNSENVFE